jgi:hypothetical protein
MTSQRGVPTKFMSHRKQKIATQIGGFMRKYQRKAQGGGTEPNDRQYSRKLEKKFKRLRPEEFDELVNGSEEQVEGMVKRKSERETRWPGR